jgi:hypothetical protein
MSDEKHGWFPATAWSKVAKAKDPSHPEFRESVNWLIGTYWRPVYRYLLVSKKFSGDPEDMTHDFICNFLEPSEDNQLSRLDDANTPEEPIQARLGTGSGTPTRIGASFGVSC